LIDDWTIALTGDPALSNIRFMIEIISFLLGLGFSLLVYILSIRPLNQPWLNKTGYFVITLIGITGTIFLIGVLMADFLRKTGDHLFPVAK